jgi:hypothetical protein
MTPTGHQRLAFLRYDRGLFDHLVSAHHNQFRDGKTERFCGLEIDDHLDFRSLVDRQVGVFLASENLADQDGDGRHH